MNIFNRASRNPIGQALPLEVYDSVVRALHSDRRALFIGMLATWIAVILVWYRTGSTLFLTGFSALFAIGILRILSILRFYRKSDEELDLGQLQSSENIYRFWSTGYVAVLGLLCFASMAVTSDGTVHLIMFVTTLGYVIGIFGRNFASGKVVNAQILAVSIPLIAGPMIFGNVYHTLLALLLVPFLAALHSISDRLRQLLFNAVLTAMDHKTIADRFEVALQNVSHGMAMVNREGEFLVANERFNNLIGIVPEPAGLEYDVPGLDGPGLDGPGLDGPEPNMTITGLTDLATAQTSVIAADPGSADLAAKLRACLRDGKQARFDHKRQDGATISISFNPMDEGAGVIVLADISDRIRSEMEIRRLANFDPLTHLPNRRHFSTIVEQLSSGKKEIIPYSLFFADLDNFKDINDSLGHLVGDKLLCAVSLRMKACLPEGGIISRFGGDEFAICLPNVIDRTECEQFASRLISEISKPVLIDGRLMITSASLGVSLCPENGTKLPQLLQMSDVALYETKAKGRGNVNFYSEQLGENIRERRKLEVDLRLAVQRRELTVHYQPLIDLKTRRITCFEALVRWNHPEKGPISPTSFIPLAEAIGIITKIGEFVLGEASLQCLKWDKDIKVAVNISSLQFQQSDVCSVIEQSLADSGLPANRLVVEVTESSALDDIELTSTSLRALAKTGVSIALDDFGTGFSSLSYLHQLPLDKVKIDRTFIESIHDNDRTLILLSGVTNIAKKLGLSVVVEGIEEKEQLEILEREIYIDETQGFYFSKPMPAEQVPNFIEQYYGMVDPGRELRDTG